MRGHLCLGFGGLGDLTGCTAEFLCLQIQRKEAIIDTLAMNIPCIFITQW